MATVPHVTSGLGLRKFQAEGFLLTRVYINLQIYLYVYSIRQFSELFGRRLLIAVYASSQFTVNANSSAVVELRLSLQRSFDTIFRPHKY